MQSSKRRILSLLDLALSGPWVLVRLTIGALMAFGSRVYDSLLAQSSLQIGEVAPDFERTTLTGETVWLKQFRGQPVLLTIGAAGVLTVSGKRHCYETYIRLIPNWLT